MAEDAKNQELIIKKIKKGGHGGHHGGAWKVAYADFVTAMMAFFLLLWLLSTTTPEQRTGVAEYFTPTVGLKDSKGIGFEGGLTPNEKGSSKSSMSNPGLVSGQVAQGPLPKDPQPSPSDAPENQTDTGGPGPLKESAQQEENAGDQGQKGNENDVAEFKRISETLMNAFEQTPELKQLRQNIVITNTPEGLKIDLVEDDTKALFAPGSAVMTDNARLMLKAVAGVILRSPNQISIAAHTEKLTYPPGAAYTSWELSADRANAARRFMTSNVLEPERVVKMLGMADRDLMLPKQPNAARNRRVTITLLRDSHMPGQDEHGAPADKGLLSAPKVEKRAKTPEVQIPSLPGL